MGTVTDESIMKLDPIKDGRKIFNSLFKKIDGNEITDLKQLNEFLSTLLKETQGLVIVDFLDLGCWDCIGSFEIDYELEYLKLNWHRYTGQNSIKSFIEKINYKDNINTLLIHFKKLLIGKDERFPFIVFNGYAIKKKEVCTFLEKDANKVTHHKTGKSNFYNLYTAERDDYSEDCFCHDTPIYSILIIPKDFPDITGLSSRLLFKINYGNCRDRLDGVQKTASTDLSEDEICEKANTVRRIVEYALKIESCYHREVNPTVLFHNTFDRDSFTFKNDYSDMLLGDLVKLIKPLKNDDDLKDLNQIAILSNELSHDSGKKITKEKFLTLLNLSTKYIKQIDDIIEL